ncbi:MAG TPA: hypothetical protein VG096_23105, partial [Bryobacteraceae bacterium]|nr:hypothetical protein [Bryobacteraceae bacterium]
SDSVVGERTFLAQSSIVVRILNAGVFARITVSDGIGEVSENLGAREALIVQTSGLGERISYRIKVTAKNLTNKVTSVGAALSVIVNVFTIAPTLPSPPPRLRSSQVPVPPNTPPAPQRVHIVKPNEYLRKIAQLYYGDPNKWKIM